LSLERGNDRCFERHASSVLFLDFCIDFRILTYHNSPFFDRKQGQVKPAMAVKNCFYRLDSSVALLWGVGHRIKTRPEVPILGTYQCNFSTLRGVSHLCIPENNRWYQGQV